MASDLGEASNFPLWNGKDNGRVSRNQFLCNYFFIITQQCVMVWLWK
jgi:hypothetical protein